MEDRSAAIPANARDVSMSMARVNVLAIPVALVPVLLLVLLFAAVNGWDAMSHAAALFRRPVLLLILLAGGVVLHELLHAAAWASYGQKPLTVITFGIHWPTLTPYAHCTVPLRADVYRLGALTPGVLLGILPACLAMFAGIYWLLFPGLVFTAAAAGDVLVVWMLRGVQPAQLVQDHPDRAGCLVFDSVSSEDSAS